MGNEQYNTYASSSRYKKNNNPFENIKLSKSLFDFLYVIGRGGFGKVWKVLLKGTSKNYALKEMSKLKIVLKRSEKSIQSERELLSNLYHPFIVNMISAFQDLNNLYLVMDLFKGGDMRYHIFLNKKFNEAQSKFFISNIILGLEYIHKNKIIHRDIKPENLVLDQNGYLAITDFGIAKKIEKTSQPDASGTPGYMAPEVLFSQIHSYSVDYYAVGVIAFEFMKGFRPYQGRDRKEIKEAILAKEIGIGVKTLKIYGWSLEGGDFINKMIKRKVRKRLGYYGIDEIKNHPFFRNLDWDNLRNTKPPFIPKPLRIKELDLELNLKNNRLGLYTSKEIQNRKYNNLKNYLNKMNLNIYDFYYNKELEEIKYNINNNIIEIIKKQVNNYLKKKKDQKNILDEISTEDITPKPSFESGKKFIGNINVYNSTNLYNSETKNKYSFFAFDKIENAENKNIKKKKSIQIIPIRNLLFNNCKNSNYKDKKDLLYKSIRFGSGIKNKLMPNNNSINNNYSVNKDKTYLMTEKKHMSKSIFKDGNINNINNTEIKIKNKSKIKDKQIYKDNIINNIKPYHEHHEKNKSNINDNDIRKIKINGKLFLVKKNLGKFY